MIMEIIKCKRCSKIFQKMASRSICPLCVQDEERDFMIVKSRLHDNPSENLEQLSKATGIDRRLIIEFIREGRLQIDRSLIPKECYSACRRCGKPTLNTRFCERCLQQLSKSLAENDPVHKPGSPSGGERSGFHFKNLFQDGHEG